VQIGGHVILHAEVECIWQNVNPVYVGNPHGDVAGSVR
jgi:hypothetical protein